MTAGHCACWARMVRAVAATDARVVGMAQVAGRLPYDPAVSRCSALACVEPLLNSPQLTSPWQGVPR